MKATIDITSHCNLRCKHCYNSDKYFNRTIKEMDRKTVTSLFYQLAEQGCDEINFLGGEPLLRSEIIDFLRLTHVLKMQNSLTTNGTLLGENRFEPIFKENLVDNLIISLNGQTVKEDDKIRGKGVFNKVMRSLERVKEWREIHHAQMTISISFCLFEQIIKSGGCGIIDICKSKGIDAISFFPVLDAGAATKNQIFRKHNPKVTHGFLDDIIGYASRVYPKLIFSIEERPLVADYFNIKYPNISVCPERQTGCGVMKEYIYIKADGTILPCGFVDFADGLKEQGNGLFNEVDAPSVQNNIRISDIYQSTLYVDFLASFEKLRQKQLNTICRGCRYELDCLPCPYQNKNGEVLEDCVSIIPQYQQIIEISKTWTLRQVFHNGIVDRLFSVEKAPSILSSFSVASDFTDYKDFLYRVISFEKKGLLKIERINHEKTKAEVCC